jgi:23S rRNA (adenine2503-C2)-methyltransferase
MGMGEPLANYNRVVGAVRRIVEPAPHGLGIGQRSVVVSTVGSVPAIEKLTDGGPAGDASRCRCTRPDDELRDTLVPVNTRWPVREVLDAASATPADRPPAVDRVRPHPRRERPAVAADLLAKRLAGKLVHVNLIPLNPTPGSEWDASPKAAEQEFVRGLRAAASTPPSATPAVARSPGAAGSCPPRRRRAGVRPPG